MTFKVQTCTYTVCSSDDNMFLTKLKFQQTAQQFRNAYGGSAMNLVTDLKNCLSVEQRLVFHYVNGPDVVRSALSASATAFCKFHFSCKMREVMSQKMWVYPNNQLWLSVIDYRIDRFVASHHQSSHMMYVIYHHFIPYIDLNVAKSRSDSEMLVL